MINRVTLMGRLSRDPENRRSATGTAILSFGIAVSDYRKRDNSQPANNQNDDTMFFDISVFGNRAESLTKLNLKKGDKVIVEGRLNQHRYARKTDNVLVTKIDIIADNVELINRKRQDENGNSGYTSDDTPQEPAEEKNMDSLNVMDDEIPF